MLTTMAAGAALAATATQLTNATDYVQQLQGLLRATEAALDTANKLNATGGRCLKLFKPMLTARAHYKDALEIYSVAMKTIMPCIGDMDQAVALAFLASAMQFLNFRKTIYEGELYKRRDCIQLRREAIKLKENAEQSKETSNVTQLNNFVLTRSAAPAPSVPQTEDVVPTPLTLHASVATPQEVVGQIPTSRNPFIDPSGYYATMTADPNVSGPSLRASA